MTLIHNAHNNFFHSAFSKLQVAKEFFQQHLPLVIQRQLDFSTLESQSGSYTDKDLKHSASDMLYRINYLKKSGFAYLYILAEHQSSVDNRMPLRLLRYVTSIWNEYLKKNPSEDTFPLVIPLVFYNGPYKYNGPRDIRELIKAPLELIDLFLFKPFQLIDTHDISDETLRERHWAGLMQMSMKHAYEKEALNYIQSFIEILKQVLQAGGTDYGLSALKYILSRAKTVDPGQLLNILETSLAEEDSIMASVVDYLTQKYKDTWLQAGVEKGIEQGIQYGEAQLLLNILMAKFKEVPEVYVQKIYRADDRTLKQWAVNFIRANTLEEVFKEHDAYSNS